MKHTKIIFGFLILLCISAYAAVHSIYWTVKDDTYEIKFSGKKVTGNFKGLKANIIFDEAHPEKSKLSGMIDVNTINTGNGVMNKEAKDEDALDAKNNGTINFVSSAVRKNATGYEAEGELTIKGISHTVIIPFTMEKTGEDVTFKGHFSINPKEYHVDKVNAKQRRDMPDKINIDISVPVK